jgi:TfoX/Sxy family transcriptional regulator of competence genes
MKRFKEFTEGKKASTDAPKGPESYEAQYKRRLVKTTDPEHKAKGYKWRIKGKKNSSLTKKLYKTKPSQSEFNSQMRRIAAYEFG